jgi:uncharacterized membrane protein YraQ (UPF0718 family)
MKMKELLKKYKFDIPIIIAFALFAGASFYMGFQPGINLVENDFWAFLKEMLVMLPAMFILIGLFDVWVPKEIIEKHIGETSGTKGIFLVIALAFVQIGPLYAAYPVAYALWKKGCSLRNIFVYIGSFSTLKLPMITFEMGFLGVKFSLIRSVLTIPVFILIAYIMAKYLKNKNFEMKKPQ